MTLLYKDLHEKKIIKLVHNLMMETQDKHARKTNALYLEPLR